MPCEDMVTASTRKSSPGCCISNLFECNMCHLEGLQLYIFFFQQGPGTLLHVCQLLHCVLPLILPFTVITTRLYTCLSITAVILCCFGVCRGKSIPGKQSSHNIACHDPNTQCSMCCTAKYMIWVVHCCIADTHQNVLQLAV